jgi:hypothetical protein
MRKLYLLLPFLLAFTFLTCEKEPEPEPEPEQPTLDERLIGGRWYFWNKYTFMPKTENGYYEFKNEFVFIHSSNGSEDNLTEYSVYTKNDTVYKKDNHQVLLQYQFPSSYPYQNSNEFYMDKLSRQLIKEIIANNNLLSCTVSNQNMNLIDSTEAIQYQFLRRYKEDGTTYE